MRRIANFQTDREREKKSKESFGGLIRKRRKEDSVIPVKKKLLKISTGARGGGTRGAQVRG